MRSVLRFRFLMIFASATSCVALLTGSATASAGARAAGRQPDVAAGPATSVGAWGKAEKVPGTASLNAGGVAEILSLSCASAGNCGAGGFYTDAGQTQHALVVNQRNDKWGKAAEVTGTVLSGTEFAQVNSVSCGSATSCSAGGVYAVGFDQLEAFIVSQRNGKWGKAIEVPGTAALNQGGHAFIFSVSCPAAGVCAAGGTYTNVRDRGRAFVVTQRDGKWGKAIEVRGNAALGFGQAAVTEVSCATRTYCTAVGSYVGVHGSHHAFLVTRRNGRWGRAIEVPGTAALNIRGNAGANSVSCPSAGNCAAAGFYRDAAGLLQAFVVSQRSGRWHKAAMVPGSALLNSGGNAMANSVSCASAGHCAAAGSYKDAAGHLQAFVVTQRNGRWGEAIEVPGTPALNKGGIAQVTSVSCPSAGNCAASGSYRDVAGNFQAFVISQRNGRWGKAIQVPGMAVLSAISALANTVSCPSTGECTAGGSYVGGSPFHVQAFVVSRT